MSEPLIKLVTGEAVLNSTATTYTASNNAGAVHVVLRIVNGNTGTPAVVTVNGSVTAANLTIPPSSVLFLEKLNTDTVLLASGNTTQMAVSVVAYKN